MSAELILHNAKIATNGVPSFVEAVAITAGRISAAGKDEEILRLRGPQTRVIEGGRRTIIPKSTVVTQSSRLNRLPRPTPLLVRLSRHRRMAGRDRIFKCWVNLAYAGWVATASPSERQQANS